MLSIKAIGEHTGSKQAVSTAVFHIVAPTLTKGISLVILDFGEIMTKVYPVMIGEKI